jgi:integrase/recombinase XerD
MNMSKVNAKNERTKRAFFRWLKNADGRCDSTVDCVESAILLWQEFSRDEDFAFYNADKGIAFKNWLSKRETHGKRLSLVTYRAYLRHLRKFFTWLVREPGYKNRIKPNAIDYLKITEREERMASQSVPRNYPSLEYVRQLVEAIVIHNEIDLRDRAMISFTLLTGMRDKAIASLPLACFDDETLVIVQNPRLGVETKFAKLIPTMLFRFDEKMFGFVIEWSQYLKAKGFGSQDPLFPRAKLDQGNGNLSFQSPTEVEAKFWHGAGRIREIFRQRSQQAGLPYYPPHTFRHLAINLAVKACKNGEEIKAISQNFGHEFVATTFGTYGNYAPSRLTEIIKEMDFSGKPQPTMKDEIREIKELLRAKKDTQDR